MGRIKDAVDRALGRGGQDRTGRGRPDGSTLGMTTPSTWRGNTVMGPSGGRATHFATTDSQGRVSNVSKITANDYKAAQSAPKKGGLFSKGGGWKPTGGWKPAGSTQKPSGGKMSAASSQSAKPSGSGQQQTSMSRAQKNANDNRNPAGPTSKSATKKAAGGLIQGSNEMKKMKRMNMGGLPSQAKTQSGPSWKPAKPATGNYGSMVSAAAKARNTARKAAMTTGRPNPNANPRAAAAMAANTPSSMPGAASSMPSASSMPNAASSAAMGTPQAYLPAAARSAAVRAVPAGVAAGRGRFAAGGMARGKHKGHADMAAAAKAQNLNGPSWKPADKGTYKNYGQAVSAAAKARNAARTAPSTAPASAPAAAPVASPSSTSFPRRAAIRQRLESLHEQYKSRKAPSRPADGRLDKLRSTIDAMRAKRAAAREGAAARRQSALDRFKTIKSRISSKTMKAGGLVKANGCAKRGKTKGRTY